MNVSQLKGQIQSKTGSANPNLTSTATGNEAIQGMFASQIGNALLLLEQAELLPELPKEINPEDLQGLEELMAMLGSMLQGTDQLNPLQQEQVQDYAAALLDGKTGLNLASKLTPLLEQLQQLSPQQLQELTAHQANDFLQALKNLVKKAQGPWEGKVLAPIHIQMTQANTEEQQQGVTPIQTMRVHHALSMYQTEMLSDKQQGVNQAGTGAEGTEDTQQITNGTAVNLSSSHSSANNSGLQAAQGYTVRAAQFGHEVSDVFVRQMKIAGLNGVTETKLILHPQALGQVNVKITVENGLITAHFVADNAASKDIIDNQLSQLRTALVQQGLNVDKLEVTHQPQNHQQQQGFDMNSQREQAREQSQQQQQNQNQQNETAESTFDAAIQTAQGTQGSAAKTRGNIDIAL
ncbi:flagellar hook-length control protein FliK [Brevibacillus dissolubilis]|uniref:flagellar hook-length control protein FliK n=1 Tax=Brevibacillus dissolubilis TaxID=1844116 RepID=UPI0011163025|nr:flagellar hook-length control protein FliK [Brevibacillus dissolubilis]